MTVRNWRPVATTTTPGARVMGLPRVGKTQWAVRIENGCVYAGKVDE